MAKYEAIKHPGADDEEEIVWLSVQVPADVAFRFFWLAGHLDQKPADFLRSMVEQDVHPTNNGFEDLTDVA